MKNETNFAYMIFGVEKGECGTPHLQGYFQLHIRKYLSTVKKIGGLKRAHLEVARGSPADNITYCSKSGDVHTFGVPTSRGRNKLDMKTAITQVIDGSSFSEMMEAHGSGFVLHRKKIYECAAVTRNERIYGEMKKYYQTVSLRPWQSDVLELLRIQNDRQILFVIDRVGGYGKTFLCTYMNVVLNAFCCENGRTVDIKHLYACSPRNSDYVAIDITRTSEDYINYEIIELLKNGRFMSTKYEGMMVCDRPKKMVVFVNNDLDYTKFSDDRVVKVDLFMYEKYSGSVKVYGE